MTQPNVFLALLVKQKEAVLPLFLESLNDWNYPKENIFIYIRTNNNTDNTKQLLEEWIEEYGNKYKGLIYNSEDVPEKVEQYDVHFWNGERFRVLGKIRQESMNQALLTDCEYYFVVDTDNFLFPETLKELVKLDLPIVAPFLRYAVALGENADTPIEAAKREGHMSRYYSNYHDKVDDFGSIIAEDIYYKILNQEVRGLIECMCVHCTYLIKREYLSELNYLEQSDRWEYMVFSNSARNKGITQYIDNRTIYGVLTLSENLGASRWWFNYLKNEKNRTEKYKSVTSFT
jgi:cellulose synthase/poly-beta-1,6-N-acetylglucosamine synthase-like glycosyltransferase